VISLDPISHTIVVDSKAVELQPLTFALFAKLLEHKNQIVSVAVLTDEVWGHVTASPDTVKQRVFLLRKALDDAIVETCFVQSVRGQGYRLVVPDVEQTFGGTIRHLRVLRVLGLAAILVLVAIFSWQIWPAYDLPSNNRVVFWKAAPTVLIDDRVGKWEQVWITVLSSNDKISFIASNRDPAQTLSNQARRTRAALISRWTVFESDGDRWVRMQLLEPKTAGVLRSDLAAIDDSNEVSGFLNEQVGAIERIFDSGVLPLAHEALISSDHPAWAKLDNLANHPD